MSSYLQETPETLSASVPAEIIPELLKFLLKKAFVEHGDDLLLGFGYEIRFVWDDVNDHNDHWIIADEDDFHGNRKAYIEFRHLSEAEDSALDAIIETNSPATILATLQDMEVE